MGQSKLLLSNGVHPVGIADEIGMISVRISNPDTGPHLDDAICMAIDRVADPLPDFGSRELLVVERESQADVDIKLQCRNGPNAHSERRRVTSLKKLIEARPICLSQALPEQLQNDVLLLTKSTIHLVVGANRIVELLKVFLNVRHGRPSCLR